MSILGGRGVAAVGSVVIDFVDEFSKPMQRQLDKSLRETDDTVKRRMNNTAKALGGIMMGVGAAAGAAGAAMGAIGIKTAADMETSKIAFETMLGSAQEADRFLRQMADFAAKTPFDMPGLQSAASSLISVGVETDRVLPIMKTLGDVTAGMGTGAEGIQRATVALQQMSAAQKISGEDLAQLRDAGIPVYDLLAAALGKTKQQVVDMAQKGKLGKDALDSLFSALENGKGLERFNGLMEKQSASLNGMASTFKDMAAMNLAAIMQPLLPILKRLMDDMMPVIDRQMQSFAGVMESQIVPGVEAFGRGLQAAWPHIQKASEVVAVLWRNSDLLLPVIVAMGTAYSIHAAATIASTVAAGAATAAQWALNAALTANPVGVVVVLLAGFAAALVVAYNRSETFRNIVNAVGAALKDAGEKVWNWAQQFIPAIQAAFRKTGEVWQAMMRGLSWAWEHIGRPMMEFMGRRVQVLWEGVKVAVDLMGIAFRGLMTGWRRYWDSTGAPLFSAIQHIFSVTKSAFTSFTSAIASGFADLPRRIAGPVNAMIKLINTGIIDNFNKVAKLFGATGVGHIGYVGVPRGNTGGGRGIGGGIQAFASGGLVGGWSPHDRADNVPAMLTANEFVLPVKATKQLMKRYGATGLEMMRQGYLPNAAYGDPPRARYADGGMVSRVHSWMRAQAGKPYVWGGAGPRGYDCSGAVSALINVIRGSSNPYSRLFATGSIPGSWKRGSGLLTIGVDRPGEKGRRIGHTAANFGGVNFESRGGGVGVLVGGRARSPYSFNHQFTLPAIGGSYIPGDGGGGFSLPKVADWIGKSLGSSPFAKLLDGVVMKLAKAGLDKLKGNVFDSGGLAVGTGYMPKNTIKPERVLSPRQTRAFEQLVDGLDGDSPASIHIDRVEINVDGSESPHSTAEAVEARLRSLKNQRV